MPIAEPGVLIRKSEKPARLACPANAGPETIAIIKEKTNKLFELIFGC